MSTESISEKTSQRKTIRVSTYLIELAIVLALFGIGGVTISGFVSWYTVVAILVLSSILGFVAGGQTFVILIGCIDLSVPSIIGFANVLVAQLSSKGWPFLTIFLLIILLAIILGTVNALISKLFKINSLITTLATGAVLQGIYLGVIAPIFVTTSWLQGGNFGTIPSWLTKTVSLKGTIGPIHIPPVVVAWAVFTIIGLVLLYKTTWGKKLYASGVNDLAAKLALTNTTAVWVVAFILSSISAALAGVLLAGFSGGASFNVGQPYLFMSIAAVVIGGTSLTGGQGGIGRTFFGSLISIILLTLIIGYGINSSIQQALLGAIIIILLGFYGKQPHLWQRM